MVVADANKGGCHAVSSAHMPTHARPSQPKATAARTHAPNRNFDDLRFARFQRLSTSIGRFFQDARENDYVEFAINAL
jgi:hypothetical protein